jgi:hypothetical protein
VGGLVGLAVGLADPSEGALSAAAVGGLTGLITNEGGQVLTAVNNGSSVQDFSMNWSSYAFSGANGFLVGWGNFGLEQALTDGYGWSDTAAELVSEPLFSAVETYNDYNFDQILEEMDAQNNSGCP